MKNATTSRSSKTDLARLRTMKDHEITVDDDAPAWTPEMFARAVVKRGLPHAPTKALVSLRIDSDVLSWFKDQGPGYQSRMNALLRAYMKAHEAG